jgi:DNA gyrase subunit A
LFVLYEQISPSEAIMEVGLVRKVDIDHEMQQSYLDYAMSVIVARALPDARDGLKPVQRRILYAMYDMGLRSESSYKKSARIVGEVLGKYHPHGDMSVYEAMARLAQDFTIRYMLVEGQGNFGSVDGDPPAAMRYTEARLASFALQLLADIDRNTVDYSRNFDDTLDEPVVLPAAAPNLLVNGSSGIAVGMATNIPPHNLVEVIDASMYVLGEWDRMDDISVHELMKFVKGPDFPTGGIILQEGENNELVSAYATGRGKLTVRGRVHLEEMGRGKSRLIITELPYLTNKSNLIERIADLVRQGTLDGIVDLRDESDRNGMRIVIELNKAAESDQTLLKLYKHTPLQSTFGIMLLALVKGEPHLLSLKQSLRVYLEHRIEVVKRRTEFDLDKAQKRAHILEGLRIAIANLDEIITTIRNSPDVETARERLMKRFKMTEIQTQAVLDMPLRRLASLERKKIEQEYKELQQLIKDLQVLLKSPQRMREHVAEELQKVKETYGDKRRTQIVTLREGESAHEMLTVTEMTPAREVWVGVTEDGKISRTPGEKLVRPAGRDAPRWLVQTNTHHILYLVSESGRAAAVLVETLPEAEKFSEGIQLNKACALDNSEKLAGCFSTPPKDDRMAERYVLTVSRAGLVKKTSLEELPGHSSETFVLTKVNGGDVLTSVMLTDGEADIFLFSTQGMAIRFSEQEVRSMGLVAAGVNGIKLKAGEAVAFGAAVSGGGGEALLLTTGGKGWRLALDEFPQQARYGQGIIAAKMPRGETLIGGVVGEPSQQALIHFRQAASKNIKISDAALAKRMRTAEVIEVVKQGDAVQGLTLFADLLAFWAPPKKTPKPRRPAVKKK